MNSNNEAATTPNEVLEAAGVGPIQSTPITVTLHTGNFAVTVSGVVQAKHLHDYLVNGITYDLQRGPATKAYIAIAGVKGKKAGTKVLPDGFKRETVEFNEANRATMEAAVMKEFAEKLDKCKVLVAFHEKEEGSDGRNKARALYAKWSVDKTLDKKLDVLDYTGDRTKVEDVVNAIHAYLIKPD